jgi:hypothetical protein
MRLALQMGTFVLSSFDFIMLKVFNNAFNCYVTPSLTNRTGVEITVYEPKFILSEITYLLTYGADTFLRSNQLCSYSGTS